MWCNAHVQLNELHRCTQVTHWLAAYTECGNFVAVVCAGIETTADTAAELGPDTVQRIVERLGSHRWGLIISH